MNYLKEIRDRALKTRVECVVLTDYWYEHLHRINTSELLENLASKIEQKLTASKKIDLVSDVIQREVTTLSKMLNGQYKNKTILEKLTNHLTEDAGLFIKLSSSKTKVTKQKVRYETIDLLAYILINQILFYFLYSKKSPELPVDRRVDEIKSIKTLEELDKYFDQIRRIDYKPIFDINVIGHIPHHDDIIREVNSIVACLAPLRIEEIKQDLYGRLIGNSLPNQTRELLASYYTTNASADLLSNLTIDAYDQTVWDLACGSGTLLMSSYDRKLKLFKNLRGSSNAGDEDDLHIRFIENDLTGTDIMPFACHLTGLNLSAKNLRAHTNLTRVARRNSLGITEVPVDIQEAYGVINEEDIGGLYVSQRTIPSFSEEKRKRIIKPSTFILDKVERIVINPPFTSTRRLPEHYRKEFTSSDLSQICDKRIGLWGYFLALSHRLLRDGGKIGAIIPISFLHGKDTLRLRRHYLQNYSLEYVVKPYPNRTFSVDSSLTDVILVARKGKPEKDHKVKFVCLKVDIDDHFSTTDVETISNRIKSQLEDETETPDYLEYKISQSEMEKHADNLMPFIFTNSLKTKRSFKKLMSRLSDNRNLTKMDRKLVEDGYQLRPKGVVRDNVITMHYNDARIKKCLYYYEEDDDSDRNTLTYNGKKGQDHEIEKTKLIKTFRTATGVNMIDASQIHDYLKKSILKRKVLEKNTANLILPNRFRLNTHETYATALFVEDALCPLNSFVMYRCKKEYAKILALYLNSVFYLVQMLRLTKQSTGLYLELKQIDFEQILIPNDETIERTKESMTQTFSYFSSITFDSIVTQLEKKAVHRLELDQAVADMIGLKIPKSELEALYDDILNQLRTLPYESD